MEQSVIKSAITDQDRRWADAIAKLTAMTYDGRLKWENTTDDPSGLIKRAYFTTMAGQGFSVIVNPPMVGNFKETVTLNVFQGTRLVKTLKNLTVVRTLSDAIQSTTADAADKEEDALKAIENA